MTFAVPTFNLCSKFLSDICTPLEVSAMKERLDVAYLLYVKKMSYNEVHEKTSVSIATITRVARFLQHENNHGYKILFSKIQEIGVEAVAGKMS